MVSKQVIVAWAEHASGPGWRNEIIWYIIQEAGGKLVQKCLQPHEQTALMVAVADSSAAVTRTMTDLVRRKLNEQVQKKND